MGPSRSDLPTGTVTFLRTDVEGSMRLARALGSGWDGLNATQLDRVRDAVTEHGGIAVRTEGDAVFAVFREALGAVAAAIDIQHRLAAHPWPDEARVRVRIGLHSGEAHLAGDDYGGFDVNRAARIASVGHGGQIILSDPTRALVAADLPDGTTVRALGRHTLRDVPQPEHLFQLDVPGLPTDFPPIRTGSATTGNLPPRLTSFVARDRELGELAEILTTARLVTITGPGGIGKTSLALELARARGDQYPDGAWLVALDAVGDPAQVPATIARMFEIYDGPGRPVVDGLRRYLADRVALLVLDNFEHLLDAAPDVAALLRAAPGVRIVVTSRAPLRIGGEQEYPVGSLAGAPTADDGAGPTAAARLFGERARSVLPGWDPGADAPVVEAICRLVDGLPLGIELAAGRVAVLPVEAIRDRLADRMPLPGAGPRDVPARQRTLEGTIAWSYELLSPSRRRLLRELAVFDGGFDLDQVRGVATPDPGEDVLDALLELADQSLIGRAALAGHRAGPGGIRFRMLETIRTFALRELVRAGEEPAIRRRHAVALLELAETAARHLTRADQVRWLDRLAADHDNIGSAIRWAIDAGEVTIAQRLSYATWRYWQLGGHLREGRALADAVVDMPRADEPSPGRMWSFAAAGGLAYWQADGPRAGELYLAQLETARQIGDRAGEADACFNLSATEFIDGQRGTAIDYLELARQRYRELGDEVGMWRTEWSASNVEMVGGARFDLAMARMMRARDHYEATGDAWYSALAAGSLAFGHEALGNRVEGLRYGVLAITTTLALRDVATTTISLAGSAMLLIGLGLSEEAATVMGAFDGLCELHGVRPPAGIGQILGASQVEERVYAALTSEEFAAAVRRGRAMSIDEAVAYVVDIAERLTPQPPPGG